MSIEDDILKAQHLVEARSNALAADLVEALESSRAQVVGKLAELQARYLTGAPWETESYARRKVFLEAQRAEIDRLIGEVYASMARPILEATEDTMSFTTAATTRSLASMAPPGLTIGEGAALLALSTVAAWSEVHTIDGMVLSEWLATMSKTTTNRIVAAGREAMILGLSVPNTARLLRQKGIEGGVQSLESLARTYLLSASNYANEQVFERNKDVIGKLRYTSVLDGRTCPICGNDDGKTFSMDEPRPSLPRHINCRCLYLPVTDWEKIGVPELAQDDTERPAVKHDSRTVHHRDGTTSTRFKVADVEHTGENYNAWITRQLKEDPAFVRRVLGKTRFELFESGQFTLDKMVVDGRIRRLGELR